MKNKMIKVSTKVMAAMIVASTVISTAMVPTYAAELPADGQETVVETVAETTEVEGQGDVIDDEFAVVSEVEGQGDVIDDEFAVTPEVEGQGDVIDDEFAVASEEEGRGDIIDDEFAVITEEEGQGDVIDDEFAADSEVEGQGDVIDDEFVADQTEESVSASEDDMFADIDPELFAAAIDKFNEGMKKSAEAMKPVETESETKPEVKAETKKTTTKKTKAPAIDMSLANTFFGYHGTEVNYKDLVVGKYYLMQIPKTSGIPTFKYRVVKILGSYTKKGLFIDDEMVKYHQYKSSGKIEYRNRETKAKENIFNLTPNHFFEITDDILVK